MQDQAAKLRELVKYGKEDSAHHAPRIIAVASGKGGVGKTNLVVNLAIALVEMGQRVVIFDADLGLANVDVLVGVVPKYNLYDVLQGTKTISEIIVTGPAGVRIVPGGSGIQDLANLDYYQRERLVQSLKELEQDTDFLLVDTGAGISRNVLGFISAADEVIIVLTPEPTSLTDAYGVIKIMSKFKLHSEVHLVVNRVASAQEAQQTIGKMVTVVQKFLQIKVLPLGYIFDDKAVGKAVRKQEPFLLRFPDSAAAGSLRQLATNLLEGNYRPPKGTTGFLNRLIRLFS
ncbi:MinD/ParA family protein [Zhaonella formicivorans]|uniref:MinD/ParA family protein n=1 Tax=Zhaonella formicivorans TaxID=2528593 RepID=UPI0010D4C52B|nr:MinD/ParA family protein [Zhaonella formicivorans]